MFRHEIIPIYNKAVTADFGSTISTYFQSKGMSVIMEKVSGYDLSKRDHLYLHYISDHYFDFSKVWEISFKDHGECEASKSDISEAFEKVDTVTLHFGCYNRTEHSEELGSSFAAWLGVNGKNNQWSTEQVLRSYKSLDECNKDRAAQIQKYGEKARSAYCQFARITESGGFYMMNLITARE